MNGEAVRSAHIVKVPKRHHYHLTDKGRQLTAALNAMLSASTEQLLDMAAQGTVLRISRRS